MTIPTPEPTIAEITKPTVKTYQYVLEFLVGLSMVIFLIIWLITHAGWALGVGGICAGYLILMTITQTRDIAEDNQKRLDFLIKKL